MQRLLVCSSFRTNPRNVPDPAPGMFLNCGDYCGLYKTAGLAGLRADSCT